MLDAKINPKGMGKYMKNKIKAPFRVGVNTKALTAKFIERNHAVISDMMWQGFKFLIEEIRSDAPYGDGSPENKVLRQLYLKECLLNGFITFYQIFIRRI